jgi:hypothetical protein
LRLSPPLGDVIVIAEYEIFHTKRNKNDKSILGTKSNITNDNFQKREKKNILLFYS